MKSVKNMLFVKLQNLLFPSSISVPHTVVVRNLDGIVELIEKENKNLKIHPHTISHAKYTSSNNVIEYIKSKPYLMMMNAYLMLLIISLCIHHGELIKLQY
jgi:hypothetical protein